MERLPWEVLTLRTLNDFYIVFFPACLYFIILNCKETPLVLAASLADGFNWSIALK